MQQKPKEINKSIAPKITEDWRSFTEMRIKQLEEKIKNIEETNQKILDLLQKFEEENLAIPESENNSSDLNNNPLSPPSPSISPTPPPPPSAPPSSLSSTQNHTVQQKIEKPVPKLKEFKPEKNESKKDKKINRKTVKIKLPLGFIKGLTLTGLDAPTFQYGRNNLHPILMVSLSKEILANNKNLNLKECFFLGSGFGEISSERAYIRLVKISCIDKQGNILEQKVSGWVLDDDGKVGLRGRVVSKQGAVLEKTFMAGLLEGLSRIIASTSTTVQISPVGTTQTLKPEDVSKVAIASGFQSATSRLAQFYMKIAEQMYPVVEVSPGRKITILISGGTEIEKDTNTKLIDNPIN